jgi:hypothetical protein
MLLPLSYGAADAAKYRRYLKGFMDLRAGLDSPEAAELRRVAAAVEAEDQFAADVLLVPAGAAPGVSRCAPRPGSRRLSYQRLLFHNIGGEPRRFLWTTCGEVVNECEFILLHSANPPSLRRLRRSALQRFFRKRQPNRQLVAIPPLTRFEKSLTRRLASCILVSGVSN